MRPAPDANLFPSMKPARLRAVCVGTPAPEEAVLPAKSSHRRGLGVIELLTLVAILAVAFALMASMARHVRSNSAMELTRKRMAALTEATSGLMQKGIDPRVPITFPSTSSSDAKLEENLGRFALESSRNLGRSLSGKSDSILAGAIGTPELRDAWGRPMALMPQQFPVVGMAPDDGPFLVSAGPDGRFLTLSDNIYSYDLPALLPTRPAPATNPSLTGVEAANAAGQPE